MNLFIAIFLYGATVIGSIWFLKNSFNKTVNNSLTSFTLSGFLGTSNEEKAKTLDKKPVENPDTQNSNSNVPSFRNPLANTFQVNRGDNLPARLQGNGAPTGGEMGLGGGTGVTAVVGLANAIGVMAQNGGVVANKFAARKQLVGPIYQGANMVYTAAKGVKQINQLSGSSLNAFKRGRIQMNQAGNQNKTTISNGRIRISPVGASNNYINGPVKGIKGARHLHTGNLQIKGISKAQSLFVDNFHAPKGTKIKLMQMANGDFVRRNYRLNGGVYGQNGYGAYYNQNNVGIAINDTLLQKGYSLKKMNYHSTTEKTEQYTMIGLRNVFADPKNRNLNSNQKVKLYKLSRMKEKERLLSGEEESNPSSRKDKKDYEDLLRAAVQKVPNLSATDMKQVADKANELKKANEMSQRLLAQAKADEKMNLDKADKSSLDSLLKQTSGVASNFNKFVEENFKDDRLDDLTEDEMKAIEQKARDIVDAREGMSQDEKQRQYEEETKRLSDEKKKRNLSAAQELVKDQILNDPDAAEDILGKEGVELLKKEFAKNRKEKDSIYQQILRRREKDEDKKFKTENKEYSESNAYEVREARKEKENEQYIEQAYNSLHPNDNKEKNTSSGSVVYIPQAVQEAMAARANARQQASQPV